jgi:hypothetical protein
MTARTVPALDPDLVAGLKRLKLAAMLRLGPEVLHTAKTQRWAPEEVLRTLVEAEIAARDDSNTRTRLRSAGFPVTKTLDEFNVGLSSIPQATFDYLASLEWVRAAENLCLVGPAGTGKSHVLIALGHAAVTAGLRVRYFAAATLGGTTTGDQLVVAKTYRTRMLNVPARLVRPAGRPRLRFPARWPWATQFLDALDRLRALPLVPT